MSGPLQSQFHPQGSAAVRTLQELNIASGDIEASVALTSDGFMIGAALGEGSSGRHDTDICAPLLNLAECAASEVLYGQVKLLMLELSTGMLLLQQAGSGAVLAVAARPSANPGLLLHAVRKAARQLQELLS